MYLLFNLHSRINIWKAFFQHSVPPWASQDTIPSSLNLPWRVSSHLPPLICILTAVTALGGLVGGGEGRGGPSEGGLHHADYLLTASRTACGIPERLLCSPTLICLNRPGLTVFPESPGWCMSKRRGHRGDQASTYWGQGLDMTNVHWAGNSCAALTWAHPQDCSVSLIIFSYFQWKKETKQRK